VAKLELKEKIAAGWITTPGVQLAEENTDVLAALTCFDYSISKATRAVASLPPSSDLSLDEKTKLALQYLEGSEY